MTMPTLHQVEAYNTEHLTEAPQFWRTAADNWGYHTAGVETDVLTIGWNGDAAARASERAGHDAAVARAVAPIAENAAQLAPAAATELTRLRSVVTTLVEQAREGDYEVTDDLQVKDLLRGLDYGTLLARDKIAGWLEQCIQQGARNLSAGDAAVAQVLDAHAGIIAGTRFADGAPIAGHIQMVDNAVCDDPDYNAGIVRRFIGSVITGAIMGGLYGGVPTGGAGAIPGSITGGAAGGILDILHEIAGDGPKCAK
jgi:hypothetical protein